VRSSSREEEEKHDNSVREPVIVRSEQPKYESEEHELLSEVLNSLPDGYVLHSPSVQQSLAKGFSTAKMGLA
jgi:hypothetical protein